MKPLLLLALLWSAFWVASSIADADNGASALATCKKTFSIETCILEMN